MKICSNSELPILVLLSATRYQFPAICGWPVRVSAQRTRTAREFGLKKKSKAKRAFVRKKKDKSGFTFKRAFRKLKPKFLKVKFYCYLERWRHRKLTLVWQSTFLAPIRFFAPKSAPVMTHFGTYDSLLMNQRRWVINLICFLFQK